jgi:transcriptional regulator with XRE-family HTH domain
MYRSFIFAKLIYITHKNEVFMAFADRLSFARKQKKVRQADLGKLVGTSGDIIGKYERGENTPSIEVAAKIADALGVTLDYLVKDGEYEQVDEETLKRLKDIQAMSPENKNHVFALLDAFIKQTKLQGIMQ